MWNNPNWGFNSGRVKPTPKYMDWEFFFQYFKLRYRWRARNLPVVKSVRNVVILCATNNLCLGAPEDIADGIIEIGSTFKSSILMLIFLLVEFYLVIVTGR